MQSGNEAGASGTRAYWHASEQCCLYRPIACVLYRLLIIDAVFGTGVLYALRRQGGAVKEQPAPPLLRWRSHASAGQDTGWFGASTPWRLEGLPLSRLGISGVRDDPSVDARLGRRVPQNFRAGFACHALCEVSCEDKQPNRELPASRSRRARCSLRGSCLGQRSCLRAGLLGCCCAAALPAFALPG